MKTNSTLIVVIRIVAFILLCLYSILVFGQAENTSTSRALPLQKFSAVVNENNIKLNWTLVPKNEASTIVIEKGYSADQFKPLAEYWVNMEGNYATEYKWSDVIKGKKTIYYRLKITEANGHITYSNILHFDGQKSGDSLVTIYPSTPETFSADRATTGEKTSFKTIDSSR